MTLHEQAIILYRKSTDDVRVLRLDLTGAVMTDEIWGFHAQQATEKLLKSIIACKERNFRSPTTSYNSWIWRWSAPAICPPSARAWPS